MNKLILGLVAVFFSLLVLLGGIFLIQYISAGNYANATEQQLDALNKERKNVLANAEQKIMTIAQVPGMYRDDLSKIIQESMQGRYGADGSKAVFQAIRETNINLDPEMYRKIQQVIEIGRDDFRDSQTRLTDSVRSYKTAIGSFPKGWFIEMRGYPKVNFKDFDNVTTERTEEVFRTKVEPIMKLR